jgi:hypothetical protein
MPPLLLASSYAALPDSSTFLVGYTHSRSAFRLMAQCHICGIVDTVESHIGKGCVVTMLMMGIPEPLIVVIVIVVVVLATYLWGDTSR